MTSVSEFTDRPRLLFQGAQIERANLNGRELEIVFSVISRVVVKDPFGFDFEAHDECRCTITIKNPSYDFLPKPGPVNDGHIALGELCYISLFPPDLTLDCPCFLMIEQSVGGDSRDRTESETDDEGSEEDADVESETFMIVGEELTVTVG